MRAFRLVAAVLLLLAGAGRGCYTYPTPFECLARATAESCTWCTGGAFGGLCVPKSSVGALQGLGGCAGQLTENYHSTALFTPLYRVTPPGGFASDTPWFRRR